MPCVLPLFFTYSPHLVALILFQKLVLPTVPQGRLLFTPTSSVQKPWPPRILTPSFRLSSTCLSHSFPRSCLWALSTWRTAPSSTIPVSSIPFYYHPLCLSRSLPLASQRNNSLPSSEPKSLETSFCSLLLSHLALVHQESLWHQLQNRSRSGCFKPPPLRSLACIPAAASELVSAPSPRTPLFYCPKSRVILFNSAAD